MNMLVLVKNEIENLELETEIYAVLGSVTNGKK